MSAKNPTLREELEKLGYREGQLSDPRVRRFIAKQSGSKWQRAQQLIRKRDRRRG